MLAEQILAAAALLCVEKVYAMWHVPQGYYLSCGQPFREISIQLYTRPEGKSCASCEDQPQMVTLTADSWGRNVF